MSNFWKFLEREGKLGLDQTLTPDVSPALAVYSLTNASLNRAGAL